MQIKEPYSTFFYIVLGVFLALGINQGLALALHTDLPIVAVQSNSMVPTFSKGDLLVLQGAEPGDISVGDVIVFSHSSSSPPVVHRVIKINPDGTYQTKGDANSGQLPFEKRIEPSQIHGKSILTVPYLGWIKIGAVEASGMAIDAARKSPVTAIFLVLAMVSGYLLLRDRMKSKSN